ncbi:MAG TPA: hypothetical protein VN442_08610 [Bryobacteraceae bacterium]|nr:hypothetical protein [Bryobacteraceae bacterium]
MSHRHRVTKYIGYLRGRLRHELDRSAPPHWDDEMFELVEQMILTDAEAKIETLNDAQLESEAVMRSQGDQAISAMRRMIRRAYRIRREIR